MDCCQKYRNDTRRLTTKHNDVKLSITERLVPVSNACSEAALFVQSEPQQDLTLLFITTDSCAVVIFRTVLLYRPQLTKKNAILWMWIE